MRHYVRNEVFLTQLEINYEFSIPDRGKLYKDKILELKKLICLGTLPLSVFLEA